MQINTTHIESLLSKVKLIVDKYDEIERITGEKYNVFSILGLSSDELAHSKFIANLLSPQGSHGQGDIYLKLFFECMREKFLSYDDDGKAPISEDSNFHVLEKFETEKARCQTEKHAGKVNFKESEGGRIDIYLKSGNHEVIIENKVHAGDQYQQLKRYHTFAPEAPIFYLSLYDSNEVSLGSKKDLIEGKHFFSISYETDVLNWIEKCVEQSASIPFIRETLRQYTFLIKRLTNQETRGIMKGEIYKLIKNSKENYLIAKAISNSFRDITPNYFLEILEYLKKELANKDLTSSIEKSNRKDDGLFIFLTDYTIKGGENQFYAIGINIELRSNHMFFCAIEKNKKRNYNINKSITFDTIAEQLKRKNISLGKAKSGRTNVWLTGSYNFSEPTNNLEHYFEMDEEMKTNFKNKILHDVTTLVNESGLIKDKK